MTSTQGKDYTPLPPAIAHAWQVMATTAHVLDQTSHPNLQDLAAMLTISEAMDTLVDVDPRYPPISPFVGAPHTPIQAASCALAHLSTHQPSTAEESARVLRVRIMLAELSAEDPIAVSRDTDDPGHP